MNTKGLLKQTLTVFALMVGALSVMAFLPAIANAGGILNPGDNPSLIGQATNNQSSLRGLILTVINYFLGFLGLLAVIMVIYGGVTYIIAAGADEAIGNAKKIIMYSVIGLIIVLLSFAIVNTVLGAGTGVEG